jgi:hypothetical protein
VQIDGHASLLLGDLSQAEYCYRLLHERYARARPDRLTSARDELARAGKAGATLAAWFGVVPALSAAERRELRVFWNELDEDWRQLLRSGLARSLDERELERSKDELSDEELAAIRELNKLGIGAAAELRSLTPLRALSRLRELSLRGRYVGPDLAGELAGLTSLCALTVWAQIDDPTPLVALAELERVDLRGAISDLSFLTRLPRLEDASLRLVPAAGIDALAGARSLRRLTLTGGGATSLDALRDWSQLEALRVHGAQHLEDLSGLSGAPALKSLELPSCARVVELAPCAKVPALRELVLSFTSVRDLSPLAAHPGLERVDVSFSAVDDLTPLASCPRLRWINAEFERHIEGHAALARGCPQLERVKILRKTWPKAAQQAFESARPGLLEVTAPDRT